MRALVSCLLFTQLAISCAAFAQQEETDPNSATAYCDFDDGQEISVRYKTTIATPKDEPRNGKVWLPGGAPITLFTGAALTFNNVPIAPGAYSAYVIVNKKDWTLIVNKNVTPSAPYDEKQDVARSPMELGEVDSPPKQLHVSFAHIAPKQCSIRLYYGKTGAFAEFTEK